MTTINLKTQWAKCRAEVVYPGTYEDGSLAIELVNADTGEREMRATVCIAEYGFTPPPGHVVIKSYSENEGLLPCLVSEGIVDEPTLHVGGPNGVDFAVCELKDPAAPNARQAA